jgi:DNA-binding XRE family transcriptional regulator
MSKRRVELEAEVLDWLDQLSTASFATAAFFIGLLSVQGALLSTPHVVQLGGKLSRLYELRFFVGLDLAGLTCWLGPHQQLVLLTLFRDAHVQRRYEVARAREAMLRCAGHSAADHVLWTGLLDPRMSRPAAAELYEVARLSYEFGRTVRLVRGQRGWSMRTLAQAAETTEAAIARCELGGIQPSTPVAVRIAGALSQARLPPKPYVPAPRAGEAV